VFRTPAPLANCCTLLLASGHVCVTQHKVRARTSENTPSTHSGEYRESTDRGCWTPAPSFGEDGVRGDKTPPS
jgi:hypothetical protein